MSNRITALDGPPDGVVIPAAQLLMDHLGAEKAYRVRLDQLLAALMREPLPAGAFEPGTFGDRVMFAGSGAGEPFGITSFEHNHSDVILQGTTIANVELTWAYNFLPSEVTSVTISGPSAPGVLPDPTDLSYTIVGINRTTTATWTIGIQTGVDLYTASVTLQFGSYVYHGRGALADLNEAGIEALPENTITFNRNARKSFAANGAGAAGAYLWFAWPDSFGGVPSMRDVATGLSVPLSDRGTVNVTNNGVTQAYRLVRSEFVCNGAVDLDVVV